MTPTQSTELDADLLRVLALAARPKGFRDHRLPSAARTAELERLGLIRFVAGTALATAKGRGDLLAHGRDVPL
jgi:hypothetical protein